MWLQRGKLACRVLRLNDTETEQEKVSNKAVSVAIRGNFKITERKFRKMSIINENLPKHQQHSAPPAS